MTMQTGFIWLRMGTSGSCCEHDDEHLSQMKALSDYQLLKMYCFMKFVLISRKMRQKLLSYLCNHRYLATEVHASGQLPAHIYGNYDNIVQCDRCVGWAPFVWIRQESGRLCIKSKRWISPSRAYCPVSCMIQLTKNIFTVARRTAACCLNCTVL